MCMNFTYKLSSKMGSPRKENLEKLKLKLTQKPTHTHTYALLMFARCTCVYMHALEQPNSEIRR